MPKILFPFLVLCGVGWICFVWGPHWLCPGLTPVLCSEIIPGSARRSYAVWGMESLYFYLQLQPNVLLFVSLWGLSILGSETFFLWRSQPVELSPGGELQTCPVFSWMDFLCHMAGHRVATADLCWGKSCAGKEVCAQQFYRSENEIGRISRVPFPSDSSQWRACGMGGALWESFPILVLAFQCLFSFTRIDL